MDEATARAAVLEARTALGIELGSTRIKAVLTGPGHTVIASGSHDWENQFVDRNWTYSLEAVWTGLQQAYAALAEDARQRYGQELDQRRFVRRVGDDARLPGLRRLRRLC